jgi:transposase-like protein
MGKYKRHSAEYIAESVRLIIEENWTYAQVAEAAEVHVSTVSNWVKRAKSNGQEKSLEAAKDKRIRELAAENKRLEKELAFSKKVAAWLVTIED